MRKIIITTDSTVDLSKELVEKYDIKVLPLLVIFDDAEFRDGIDIYGEELYNKVEQYGKLPSTAGVSPAVFMEFWQPYLDDDCDILYMGIGSQLSTTYQSAVLAARELPENRVRVVDSQNLSGGIGLLMMKMCKFRDQGMALEEIASNVEKFVPYVKCQFVIEGLDYLYKGGRCSTLAMIIGSVLHIKPLIIVRNGTLSIGKKIIGSMKKSLNVMIDLFINDLEHVDPDCIFVTSTCAKKNEDYIRSKIDNEEIRKKVKDIHYTEAGSVIASHCGRGTIGILYIVNNDVFIGDRETLSVDEN